MNGVRSLARPAAVAACLVCVAAVDARAQGFFARPLGTRTLQQTLTLDFDVAAGSDTLRGQDGTPGQPNVDRTGSFGSGSTALNYSIDRSWLSAGAHASTIARYFSARPDALDVTHYGGANARMDLPLSGRVRLATFLGASVQPITALTLFPDMFATAAAGTSPVPTDFDLGARLGAQFDGRADARLSYALSRRSDVSAGYSYYRTTGALHGGEHTSQRGEVRFHQALTRMLSFHVGYGRDFGYRTNDDGSRDLVTQDLIDIGIDFGLSRTLALSRSMTVSFDTGSTIVSYNGDRRFDVTGDAAFDYRFRRDWTFGAAYSRGVRFNASFAPPLFADNFAGTLNGRAGRFNLSSRAGVATGNVGFDRDNGFWAHHSGADASLDVGRWVAVTLGYSYYRYRFDQAAPLPAQFGAAVSRHSVFAGASVSLPLIGTAVRRAYAAR